MKRLIILLVNLGTLSLSAFEIIDSVKTDHPADSLMIGSQSDITEQERNLLRLRLLTNSFNTSAHSFLSDPALMGIIRSDSNFQISQLNIIDEYLLKRLSARNQAEEELTAFNSAMRSERLLGEIDKFRYRDPDAVAKVRKYLGVSRKTAAFVLLLIHLVKF